MSISSLDLINQTTLIPQSVLGYSSNGQSAVQITSTDITIGGNLTTTPIYVNISASTGLTTTRVGGLDVNCDFDMNSNDITELNTLKFDTTGIDISDQATDAQITSNNGGQLVLTCSNDLKLDVNNASIVELTPNNLFLSGNIISKNRIYQRLNIDPSYNAVNGYYGLSKDAYPALNPYSSGVKAVSTWNTRTSAVDNFWRSVCWSAELSLFVAVASSGTGNRVMTSPDGITWTARTSAVDNSWRSVCWSPELRLFVAVSADGTGNRVMTSPDGITWTARTTNDNQWRSVCWSPELRLFVAVSADGTGNKVMTSPDGITWTTRTTNDNNWGSVCWSPELGIFVAISSSGTGNRVMTSPDGITWTARTSAVDNSWISVCWSPELGIFVAISSSGTGNRVMTSPDGITWTARTTNDNQWQSVCWSPELGIFVAVALSGTGNRVMTSPDGITWTARTSAVDNNWGSVCWSPELGIFVAVALSGTGNRVMTSILRARPPTSYNVFDSSFNNIDSSGNWTFKAKEVSSSDSNVSVGSTSGNTEIKCNATGAGGTITLTGGTGLLSATAGGSASKHLVLTINGTPYKIALLNP